MARQLWISINDLAYPDWYHGSEQQEQKMITLTFPDGAKREVEPGSSAAQVAASISKSLEKKAVAAVVNGVLVDLAYPINEDATLQIVTRDDERALELIRHDAAHVLAEAVQEIYPGTQVTIGPVIENGFYYDFFRNEIGRAHV